MVVEDLLNAAGEVTFDCILCVEFTAAELFAVELFGRIDKCEIIY